MTCSGLQTGDTSEEVFKACDHVIEGIADRLEFVLLFLSL